MAMQRGKSGLPIPEKNITQVLEERKKKTARSERRVEENEPSWDYLKRLVTLGPREGESYLAYRKRLAAIEEARKLWCQTWQECKGNQTMCTETLGIPKGNLTYELRQAGLTTRMLNEMIEIGLPKRGPKPNTYHGESVSSLSQRANLRKNKKPLPEK